MNTRKFVLIGDHNSGMAALQTMLRHSGIWVDCLEGIDITNATNVLIKFIQNRSHHTVFLIVVPITLRVPPEQWLTWLKIQANKIALSSFNFFRNAMIVFTHADEICPTLDEGILKQILRQKCEDFDSWEFLLSSVNRRFICVNSTLHEQTYISRILYEIYQISKPSYTILIHGNNGVKSSKVLEKLQLSDQDIVIELEHVLLKFYCYPDLDLFQGIQEPDVGEKIRKLIGSRDHHGEGITLILILISQNGIFSTNMKEMITDLPCTQHYGMDHTTEQYWWDYTTILFSFGTKSNDYRNLVLRSIEGNVGIREVVKKAGGRYIWMSDTTSRHDLEDSILSQCNKMREIRYGREFIGGSTGQYARKMKVEKYRIIQALCTWCILIPILLILLLCGAISLFCFPVTLPMFLYLTTSAFCLHVIFRKVKHFLIQRNKYSRDYYS